MIYYALLLCVGLWLNRHDTKMLALTLVVAAGIFIPISNQCSAYEWFLKCIGVEIGVIFLSRMLKIIAADVVCLIGYGLILAHLVGWLGWGSFGSSSYRIIVPMLEYSQQIVCILFCPFILDKIRARYDRIS